MIFMLHTIPCVNTYIGFMQPGPCRRAWSRFYYRTADLRRTVALYDAGGAADSKVKLFMCRILYRFMEIFQPRHEKDDIWDFTGERKYWEYIRSNKSQNTKSTSDMREDINVKGTDERWSSGFEFISPNLNDPVARH